MEDKTKEIVEFVKKQYEDGNIVIRTLEGLMSVNISEFIHQPVEGLLYDLNRAEEVILADTEDPRWINDYAVCKTIRALKEAINKLNNV